MKGLSIVDIDKIEQMRSDARIQRLEAASDDCEGWILYKKDDISGAVSHLSASISKRAEAMSYLHLALEREIQIKKAARMDRSS